VRIVLDTNILVRAFVHSDGFAHNLLLSVLASDHLLLPSNEMLAELTRSFAILSYQPITAKMSKQSTSSQNGCAMLANPSD